VLWGVLNELRGALSLEEALLLVLQVLFVRFGFARADSSDAQLSRAHWGSLLHSPQHLMRQGWMELTRELGYQNATLGRALSLDSNVSDRELWVIVRQLDKLSVADADWGEVATSLLRRYQETAAARGAGFATSESLTRLLVALLSPIEGLIYDPAAGPAMVLAHAWRRRTGNDVQLLGQEIHERGWRLGYLHLGLTGASFELKTGDTLRDDRFRGLHADRIALDAPAGKRVDRYSLFGDERWKFGESTTDDWLWPQHALFHLGPNGVAAVLMSPRALHSRGADVDVRRRVIEAGVLDAVIDLPPGFVSGTAAAFPLLLFARARENRRDRILFIDARQLGEARRGKSRELSDRDVQRVADAVNSWRGGMFEPEPFFSAEASAEQIHAQNFDLSPQRYVQFAPDLTEPEGEPIGVRVGRLGAAARGRARRLRDAGEPNLEAVQDFTIAAENRWPLVQLGNLLVLPPQTGSRLDPDGEGDPLPFIQTSLVTAGRGVIDELPDFFTRGKIRGRLAKRNDLVLASRGISPDTRVGCAVVMFDGEAAFAESLMLLTPDAGRVHPRFLRLFLTSRHGLASLVAATTGSVIANLRPSAVEAIAIRLPPIVEQERIVDSIQKLESSIAELSETLATWRHVYDTIREGVAGGELTSRQAHS
jgi:hypothetical protein